MTRRSAHPGVPVHLAEGLRSGRRPRSEVPRFASDGGPKHAPFRRSQVVRMRISGHRTDSMERRYNIVDIEDIQSAKELMQRKRKVSSEREDPTE